MNIEQVIGYGGYLAGLAGAWVYFRGSSAKNTIDLQKSEIEALSTRLHTVEKQNAEQIVESTALRSEIAVLRDLVKERSSISELSQLILKEFAASREDHKKITTALTTIADTLIANRR